jgi:hypothetical protein
LAQPALIQYRNQSDFAPASQLRTQCIRRLPKVSSVPIAVPRLLGPILQGAAAMGIPGLSFTGDPTRRCATTAIRQTAGLRTSCPPVAFDRLPLRLLLTRRPTQEHVSRSRERNSALDQDVRAQRRRDEPGARTYAVRKLVAGDPPIPASPSACCGHVRGRGMIIFNYIG